jgi:hypothetical protein
MSNLYRGPSIDASYQVIIYMFCSEKCTSHLINVILLREMYFSSHQCDIAQRNVLLISSMCYCSEKCTSHLINVILLREMYFSSHQCDIAQRNVLLISSMWYCSILVKQINDSIYISTTFTSDTFPTKVLERCWLNTGQDAAIMKLWKNSWHPGNDGSGHGPPELDGFINLSCNLKK